MAKRWNACVLAVAMLLSNSANGQQVFNNAEVAKGGWVVEQRRSGTWSLAQHKRMSAAIDTLQPQRAGTVDAYVVSIGLDSDPVFGREAGEAAKVLSRRYNAVGRTIYLTAGADDKPVGTPQGSPSNLATALAAVAAKMDLEEDVLILFATSHGDPVAGLAYRDGNAGTGMIAPQNLAELLDGLGFKRRMILLSACYSGIFVPMLTSEQSVILTAAASNRTSFGCLAANDWTFFGDALINNALRKSQPLDKAADEAVMLVTTWESTFKLVPSRPQVYFGDRSADWLKPLEARMPKTQTAKVGRPAIASM